MPPFLAYLEAGLNCIPIRSDGSKAPSVAWREFMDRQPTPDEAADWEKRFEGIGIIGGKISRNLEVIDVDEPTLVRPYLETIKETDPSLYDRLCLVKTPRRNETGQAGCHAIYRCESEVTSNTKLAMTEPEVSVDSSGKPVIDPNSGKPKMAPRCLIETRGEGGYIVAVGSSGKCHPSGRQYEHVHGPKITDLETLSVSERDTLHRVARMFDRSVAETHTDPPIHGYERVADGESPGDAFNQRSSWNDVLQPHGWQCVGEAAGVKRWRRPGKSTGISATTGILSKAGNELLTVFSTNAHPFEGNNANGRPGVCYSKFAAFAILNHHGDYEAAAKELLKLGYGTPAHKTENKSRVMKATAHDAERQYLALLRKGETQFVSLGLSSLDHAIGGGVERGEMVIIGGLTSHGKSVCALQAARGMVEAGGHVVLVSHEMGGLQIARRLIQARTTLDAVGWYEHVDQLSRESESYWNRCGKMFLLEQCREIEQIEVEVEKIAAEFTPGLVIIDHAQLTQGRGKSRYEIMTEASGRFKQLAIKHDCPVIVPSQLNRQAAQGEAEAHHLKESGALEQDADVVILVRWPWKANPDKEDPRRYVFKIVKNRNRPIVRWTVEAKFNPARQLIESETTQERWTEFDSPPFAEGEEF